jgi:hypothetical protein
VDVRREQCLQTPPAEAKSEALTAEAKAKAKVKAKVKSKAKVKAKAKAKAKSKALEETHKRPKVSKVCREGVNGRES